jgi:hypothetical protein
MIPNYFYRNLTYACLSSAILSGKRLLSKGPCGIFSAYFDNLIVRVLGVWACLSFAPKHWIVFPVKNGLSAFSNRILLVIRICSEKQVKRIAARRIVAMMAHKHVFRNFSKNKFVGNSVTKLCFLVAPDGSVSTRTNSSLPIPASSDVPDAHLSPKSSSENKTYAITFLSELFKAICSVGRIHIHLIPNINVGVNQ